MSSGTKLFGQDIVQKASDPQYIGIVLKCWHDEDHVQPETPLALADPLLRPLKYGEVVVSFISHNGPREVLHESELRLLDRALQLGDYCKRSLEDFRSGVVTGVKVKGRLHHAISHEAVPGWFTAQDLKDRMEAEVGDYVSYDDWIGQIVEVFDEYIVQLSSGQLVRLPELGSRLNVGERGPHVLPPPDLGVQQVFSFFARGDGGENDTVLYVRHNTYAVAWLALNQSLDPAVYEHKPRPERFWYGEELSKLSLILCLSDLEMRLGDRVELKNATGLPLTQHGQEADPTGVLCVQIFRVKETETTVDVLWQDGSKETLKATGLVPYLNPDEYDCWPGDQVVLKDEDTERPGVVQFVDSVERTASLLFPDTVTIEMASLLQLDTHGNPDQPIDGGVGVRLGDFVFIHKIGETNGSVGSRVPRIGEVEQWVREQTYDEEDMMGWRKAMHDIGKNIAAQRGITGQVEKSLHRPVRGSGQLAWCGEVTALNLDGTVQVTHPDFSIGVYPLNRLTRLYDGIEQLENDVWAEGEEEDADSEYLWAMDESGDWQPAEEGGGDWEDVSDEDPGPGHTHGDAEMNIDKEAASDPPPISQPPDPDNKVQHNVDLEQAESSEESIWTPFRILSSAPVHHAFYNASPAQPSKLFLTRLRKEYKVLESSLPETILVRAFEDRADLLRSLIIGPENTPYADAPFVIDWMLDSDFPNSPPKAYFLSWTNGNGRVNPNLYEEGKVCLSLLGTWQGDKHEVWSAQRSSILQALISVQGLVLVKEPWFCEPAYEKLRGTPDAIVNSRLYSEKAYILSRGFVSRALGVPLGSLQGELDYFYHHHGRLQKVIDDAQALVDKSRTSWEASDEDWENYAIPKLTAGGIIMLERILKKLRTQSRNMSLLPSVPKAH